MKNYHCSKIENNKKKNDKGKISSSDKISQTNYPMNNKIYVKNFINSSNSMNNNDLTIKKTEIIQNVRNKFQKIKNDNKDLQLSNNSTKTLIEPYNNHMNYSTQNYSNIYRNTYQNNLKNPSNSENNIKTIYLSNSLSQRDNENNQKIKLLEEECENYRKILNEFSNDVYHFLGTVVNLQNNIRKNIPENLKLTFEKEKKILTQKCSTYISNYKQNNIEKFKYNYSNQNVKTESNINKNEYEQLKNEFDLINKELFITQRQNNELRDEIHILRKSLNVDNMIKVNTDIKKKEIEFRTISSEKTIETQKRNYSNSSINSNNNINVDGEYKRNYKIVKNENEKMKGIITNLSMEIADMKKKNYELSPSLDNKYRKESNDNKIENIKLNKTTPKKQTTYSVFQNLEIDKTQLYENQIKNLTIKNNEMANQLKEINIQRNKCLNIIKQDEFKMKEQENTIQNYIIEIKQLKKIQNDKKVKFDEDYEETIKKLENEKYELNCENDNLNNELNELKMKIKNMEKNNNESKIDRDYKINDITGLKLKIKKLEKTNSDLKIENKTLNDDIYELKNKIKKSNLIENNNINEIKGKMKKLEEKNTELNCENETLNKDVNELKGKIKRLEKTNSDLKIETLNTKDIKIKIKSLEEENSDLNSINKNLNEELDDITKKIKKLEEKNLELIKENKDKNTEISSLENQIDELGKKYNELVRENKKIKKTNLDILSKSENDKSNFEKLIYYNERDIKQLNRQIDNLKKEKEKIKKEYEDKIKKLKENDTSKNLNTINSSTTSNLNIFRNRRLNRKGSDSTKVSEDNVNNITNNEELEKKIKKLNQDLNEKELEIKKLNIQIVNLHVSSNRNNINNEFNIKLEEKEKIINELKNNIEKLIHEQNILKKKSEEQIKIITSLNEEVSELKYDKKLIPNPYNTENNTKNNSLRSFSQNNFKSSRKEKNYNNTEDGNIINQFKNKNRHYQLSLGEIGKNNLDNKDEIIKNLNLEIEELKENIEDDKENIKNLKDEIIQLKNNSLENRREKKSLNKEINELKSSIVENEKDYQKLLNEKEEFRKENLELLKNIKDNKKEISELKDKIFEISKTNNKEIENLKQNKNILNEVNEGLKNEISKLNIEIKKIKNENKSQIDNINKLNIQLSNEKNELRKKK